MMGATYVYSQGKRTGGKITLNFIIRFQVPSLFLIKEFLAWNIKDWIFDKIAHKFCRLLLDKYNIKLDKDRTRALDCRWTC